MEALVLKRIKNNILKEVRPKTEFVLPVSPETTRLGHSQDSIGCRTQSRSLNQHVPS